MANGKFKAFSEDAKRVINQEGVRLRVDLCDLGATGHTSTWDGRLGFLFDSDPVQNEVAACTAIVQEYGRMIDSGWLIQEDEVVRYADEFNQKLYANGLQKILDEAQKQADAFDGR